MKRTWIGIITCALLVGGLGYRFATADDDDSCKFATKGDSPVAKACAQGGRKAAQKVMKAAVKAAKANGTTFRCDGCHEDMDSYQLKDNARDDFKKLLAAASGAKKK